MEENKVICVDFKKKHKELSFSIPDYSKEIDVAEKALRMAVNLMWTITKDKKSTHYFDMSCKRAIQEMRDADA